MSANTIYRNVRKTDFTQINNSMLWEKELTLQAKGLLSIFLSNSNDWDLNMKEIINRSKNGRDAHYKIVKELIEKGYFARIETNGSNGFESMQYLFSDNPKDIEEELINIEKSIPENKVIYIEYKGRTDKLKKEDHKKKERLDEEIEDAIINTFTESQETPVNKAFTESQETESPYTESQYINNTNCNNTNLHNTNKDKEEEKITRARKETILYQLLNDFLRTKEIDQKTIDKTIVELYERGITFFTLENVKKQYEHMMKKLQLEEVDNHNNFPLYFVIGLEMRCSQSVASKKYQTEKEQEYEEMIRAKNERDTLFYFNWLEDAE